MSASPPNKPYPLNLRLLRRLLIVADDLVHVAVALVLLTCAVLILGRTVPNLFHADLKGLLHVLNDVLLALIVMELLWPVLRFLKREPFSLSPFLYVGMISSTRRILLIEAEHSLASRLGHGSAAWAELWPVLAELGSNVGIILLLALALRLLPNAATETRIEH